MLNSAKNLYPNLLIVRKRKTQKSNFWRPHKDLQGLPKVALLDFRLLFLYKNRSFDKFLKIITDFMLGGGGNVQRQKVQECMNSTK
jgi:hypothetical protein